ncbi:MAG TPA: hypothetical protein PKC91_13280 [Ignavibacteria bacterium]|nr:hypothetical protein [Ignavibacteria bacterium]
MINSKVLQILSSFSEKELEKFEEFLNSPFLNKNIPIIRLFKLIRKFDFHLDGPLFSQEILKVKLPENRKSNDAYLRNLFSDLKEKAEDFLSYINYKNDNSYDIHLLKELYNRDDTIGFEKKLRKFELTVQKERSGSPTYYHDRAFVTEMKTNSKVNKKLIENIKKEDIENKFYFFLLSIMESYCQTFIERQRADTEHDFTMLEYFLDYIKQDIPGFKKEPLILIYYYACMCFLNNYDNEYFNLFISSYNLNKKNISHIDKRNINSLILTYYGIKNNNEPGKYYREALKIYNDMIDNNYLSHTRTGYIDLIAVRNIIYLHLNLKEKKPFETFIRRINSIVPPEQRKEILLYANSLYNILLNDFERALSFLFKINFNTFLESVDDNLYFKIDVKKYSIVCLIELGHLETALAQIDSFKHYLNYSGIIPKDIRMRNHKFINLLKEIVSLKMKFDEYKLHLLEKKIGQSNEMNSFLKHWMLEKCRELDCSMQHVQTKI